MQSTNSSSNNEIMTAPENNENMTALANNENMTVPASASTTLRNRAFDTVVRENMHRYWAVPVLSVLAYLLFCLLPVLMNYRDFGIVSNYAANMMTGASFVILFVMTVTAVIASAAVFGYLHDPVSATAVHAMPVDRKRLFSASVWSGWLFVMLPLAVIMFLLLLMRGATVDPSQVAYGYSENLAKETFTLSHALTGGLTYVFVGSCVYAVCCLAAVLSGKRGIHVLLSMFLIVLPNMLLLVIQSLCSGFLYGFAGFNINGRLISPLGYALMKSSDGLDLEYLVYYVGWTALLLFVAYMIYRAVRLERIGSACTFPAVADVLCILLTFISAIGLAEIIVSLTSSDTGDDRGRMLITSLITSVACYLVMRMIADSTPAVFHVGTLKKFLVYLAILAAVLAFTVFDVTGFQTRVPDASRVQSVSVQTDYPDNLIQGYRNYSDPETVEAVAGLQQALVDTRNIKFSGGAYVNAVDLTWHLANGRTMRRTYVVYWSPEYKSVTQAMQKLHGCEEFQAAMQIDAEALLADAQIVTVYGNEYFDYNVYEDGEAMAEEPMQARIRIEDWNGLVEAMNKDIAARAYDQTDGNFLYQVTVAWTPDPVADGDGSMTDGGPWETIDVEVAPDGFSYITYNMYGFDKNTEAFLREKGYYDRIVKP